MPIHIGQRPFLLKTPLKDLSGKNTSWYARLGYAAGLGLAFTYSWPAANARRWEEVVVMNGRYRTDDWDGGWFQIE